jgi:hypothetical protein
VTLEDGSRILVVPSSRQNPSTKAFLLISISSEIDGIDVDLLNVYANQAEVLYHVLTDRAGDGRQA